MEQILQNRSAHLKQNISITLLFFICAVLLGLQIRQFTLPMGMGDSAIYLRMAEDPGSFAGAPWGYRIAIPYTAAVVSRIFGVSLPAAFGFLQMALFAGLLMVLFRWLSDGLGLKPSVGGLAVALCAFSYPTVYHLHNAVHVGLAEHLLVLYGCMLIHRERYRRLLALLFIGGFVKESIGFLLLPTFFVSKVVARDWRRGVWQTAGATLTCLVPFLLLRSGIIFSGQSDIHAYASFYSWDYVKFCYGEWGGRNWMRGMAYFFAPLLVIAMPGFWGASRQMKALVVLPLLAGLQIILATDFMRMVGVGVPVYVVFGAITLSRLRPEAAVLITMLTCLHFILVNHRIGVTAGIEMTLLGTLVVLWFERERLCGGGVRIDVRELSTPADSD